MSTPDIAVTRQGAVMQLRFNRPGKRNAITAAMYAAVGHADKELQRVVGANHYYSGQRGHLAEALGYIDNWLVAHQPASR